MSLHIETLLGVVSEMHRTAADWTREQLDSNKKTELGDHVCDGCRLAGCCKQPVLSTFIEALPIALALKEVGSDSVVLRAFLRDKGLE